MFNESTVFDRNIETLKDQIRHIDLDELSELLKSVSIPSLGSRDESFPTVEDEDLHEIREDSDSEDSVKEIGVTEVMDLDPEESREAEVSSSEGLDPATREAEVGSSEGLVRALVEEDGEQRNSEPVVPENTAEGLLKGAELGAEAFYPTPPESPLAALLVLALSLSKEEDLEGSRSSNS